jgi:hypothetical protein
VGGRGAYLAGQLATWPNKDQLALLLRNAGLKVIAGKYSIRIEDCSHFAFEEYGGDIGEPTIDADADTPEDMMRDARLVSNALTAAGIKHRFEIYNASDELVGYLHHCWPPQAEV